MCIIKKQKLNMLFFKRDEVRNCIEINKIEKRKLILEPNKYCTNLLNSRIFRKYMISIIQQSTAINQITSLA